MFSIFTNLKKKLTCDPNKAIEVFDLFQKNWVNFGVISSKSTDDYMLRNILIKRILITFFFNVFSFERLTIITLFLLLIC